MGTLSNTSRMKDAEKRAATKGFLVKSTASDQWYVEKEGRRAGHGMLTSKEEAIKWAHTLAYPCCV